MTSSADTSVPPDATPRPAPLDRAFRFAPLDRYTRRQRLAIRLADLAFYSLIRVVGRTARLRVEGWEHWERARARGEAPIVAFWHDRIFLGTYIFRDRGIIVMTSQSFDGEYIARFIQRFGYGAARGSSTRGGTGALVEMIRLARSGHATSFAVDGPKGPRHVAKTGALMLAKKTGQPIIPFAVDAHSRVELKSWDRGHIPLPFTRADARLGAPIYVRANADDDELAAKRDELQAALETLSGE